MHDNPGETDAIASETDAILSRPEKGRAQTSRSPAALLVDRVPRTAKFLFMPASCDLQPPPGISTPLR
jgi:hypothetical protein